LNSEFFDYLDADESCILEAEPLENLVADRELMLYKNDGFWQSVDTYRELQLVNSIWKQPNPPWKVWK